MRERTLFYKTIQLLLKIFSKVYFRLEVVGLENIPKSGGVIIACNHASNIDPPIIGASFPDALHSFGKEELFQVPVLGWFIRKINAMPIKRGGVDRKTMKIAAGLLKNGEMLLIFPEGTRSHDGNLQEPKIGVSMFAYQSRAKILPVYIDGSYQALPRNAIFMRPSKVKVYIGEPIIPDYDNETLQIDKKQKYEILSQLVMNSVGKLKKAAEKA